MVLYEFCILYFSYGFCISHLSLFLRLCSLSKAIKVSVSYIIFSQEIQLGHFVVI